MSAVKVRPETVAVLAELRRCGWRWWTIGSLSERLGLRPRTVRMVVRRYVEEGFVEATLGYQLAPYLLGQTYFRWSRDAGDVSGVDLPPLVVDPPSRCDRGHPLTDDGSFPDGSRLCRACRVVL